MGTNRNPRKQVRRFGRAGSVTLVAALLLSVSALAQDAATPPASPPLAEPAPQPAKEPTKRPGIFGTVSRWFDESTSAFRTKMKGAQDAFGDIGKDAGGAARDAAGAATDAAGTVIRLPVTRVVTVNELCASAPNGAPDCRATAIDVCRKNGFKTGKTVDIYSAHKCPPEFWQTRRTPSEPDCTVETFVSKAACQ